MSSELIEITTAFSVTIAVLIGLVALIFSVTVGFKKIAEIENIVGPQGSTIDIQKRAWGGSPVGRWIRIVYLMSFFFWRRIPGHGVKVASGLGDIDADVPWQLRRWLVIPMGVFWFSILMMIVGWLIVG